MIMVLLQDWLQERTPPQTCESCIKDPTHTSSRHSSPYQDTSTLLRPPPNQFNNMSQWVPSSQILWTLPFLTTISGILRPQTSHIMYKLELVECRSLPSSFRSRSDTLLGHPASLAICLDARILIPESMSCTGTRERHILESDPGSVNLMDSMAVPEDLVTDLAGKII